MSEKDQHEKYTKAVIFVVNFRFPSLPRGFSDALDCQAQGDALAEKGDAKDAHGQPDALQAVVRGEEAGHPVIHGEPRPQAEDAHPGYQCGDIPGERVVTIIIIVSINLLDIRVAVGMALGGSAGGLVNAVSQDDLVDGVREAVDGLGEHGV